MERLTNALSRFCRPVMRPVSRWLLSARRTHYTWVYEYAFVACLLVPVALLTTDWTAWRGIVVTWATAVGVFFSFGHAKVATRMMEAQASVERPTVPCYRKSDQYWLIKEIAWFIAFLVSGMYPALVGNFIFLLYPSWRKVHVETRFEVRGTRLAPDQIAAMR